MKQRSSVELLQPILERAKGLGIKTLPEGTELLGHVPHVGPDAWLHVLYARLSEADLDELAARTGRRLPEQYRQLLRETNGLSLFSGALYISGLRRSYERKGDAVWQPFAIEEANVLERPADAKPDYVFIGGYKADGSRLFMAPDRPDVFRCERDSAVPLNKWKDLPHFLVSEAKRLATHFDESGRRIDAGTSTAPPPD
jgi:hypothetical protein